MKEEKNFTVSASYRKYNLTFSHKQATCSEQIRRNEKLIITTEQLFPVDNYTVSFRHNLLLFTWGCFSSSIEQAFESLLQFYYCLCLSTH